MSDKTKSPLIGGRNTSYVLADKSKYSTTEFQRSITYQELRESSGGLTTLPGGYLHRVARYILMPERQGRLF